MFVVYNLETTVLQAQGRRWRYYHHARTLADTLNRQLKRHETNPLYAAVHVDFHRLYVRHKIMVRSVRFGNMVEEWSDTPYYLSVGSNTYWES